MIDRTPPSPGPVAQRPWGPGARVLAPLLLLPILLIVLAWIATRSWFIVLAATPALEKRLGGDVEIDRAAYRGRGTFVLEDITLRSRQHEGPAAEALRIGRAVVRFELGGAARSGLHLQDLRLDDVRLRLSEDHRQAGHFNIQALEPQWSASVGREHPLLPPTVRITNAVIEVGTHAGRQYWPVGERRFTGRMRPAADTGGWYNFELGELGPDDVALPDGLQIEGEWNVETLEHWARIEGLTLDERTYGMCPQMARIWWKRMRLEGPVGTAYLEWRKDKRYKAELLVDQVALTLPLAVAEFFPAAEGAASLPRMHVSSGTLRLEGDRLKLENLIGEFRSDDDEVGMPYAVNLVISDLPAPDWEHQAEWMEQVLATAPFEMTLQMDDFTLGKTSTRPAEGLELPRQVADTLAKFNLTGWTLTTKVTVTRDAPAVAPDGTRTPALVQTTGQAYIRDASGAFIGFPYPLEHVNAYVEFDNDGVTVHYLNAQGSGNATVRMSGTIAPPGKTAQISLRLIARDIPLDEWFREALKGGQLATYDRILHQPSFRRIVDAGVLADDAGVDAARRKRAEKVAELAALSEGDDDATRQARERLEREIRGLATLIEAGPFELGGVIDLELDIQRPLGADQQTDITGQVDIHQAGVVYQRFPYPIYVLGGRLDVQQDRVVIEAVDGEPGIPIATPGGGRGRIVGEVRLVRDDDGGGVEPDLTFQLRGDALSELLYSALPVSTGERRKDPEAGDGAPDRSLIGRVLAGAGLRGWLDHTGVITADEAGNPTFDFAVELYDGTARPNEELFETMREFNLPSPKGLTLDGVEALLRISPKSLKLVDFAGQHKDARITAAGEVDLRSDPLEAQLTVHFNNLELDRYMVELTPGAAERTAALWDRYQPQGVYSARLDYHVGAGQSGEPELILWPQALQVVMGGRKVWIDCEQGELTLNSGRVNFGDFRMRVRSEDRDEGLILLDGSYGFDAGRELRLEGSWTDGELASPIIAEALHIIGAQQQAERYRQHEPRGAFDAKFDLHSGGGGPPRFEFIVQPDTIGLQFDDVPVWTDLDPEAEIAFTPGRIVLRNVGGEHLSGRFRVDGAIGVDELVDVDIDLSYQGRIDSPQLLAILPPPVRETFETLKIHATDTVDLQDAWLRVIEVEPALEGAPSTWESGFGGRLATHGAGMDAGPIEFRAVDGLFEILIEHEPENGTTMDLMVRASRARMLGREFNDVETRVFLSEDRQIVVPALRAEAYGGVVTGRARVGLDPGSPYQARIELAGVSLEAFALQAEDADGTAPPPPVNPPSGETYGSLAISGERDRPGSRRGRGALRVAWGKMASMPLTLRVLQVFELMPPFSGNLDFADVELYLSGDRIVFEKLFLECPTLQLHGEGEMSFPGLELDVRFRTRGTVPLVGDLVAGISDALFVVQITGPLGDPKARLVPLPIVSGGHPPATGSAAHAEGG